MRIETVFQAKPSAPKKKIFSFFSKKASKIQLEMDDIINAKQAFENLKNNIYSSSNSKLVF